MAHRAERWKFIEEYLKDPGSFHCVSVVDQMFHEAYHEEFPEYKVIMKLWGACPVPQAMRDLKTMYDCGILKRSRIGLGINWQAGFPKWVWEYGLKEEAGQ